MRQRRRGGSSASRGRPSCREMLSQWSPSQNMLALTFLRQEDQMRIGYARVSTEDQKLDLQRDGLGAAGCEKIFEEKVCGSSPHLPAREQLLDYARAGDIVVVWKLDRLGRSLRDLIEVVLDTRSAASGSARSARQSTPPRPSAS